MRCSHVENWWLSCLLCLFLAAVFAVSSLLLGSPMLRVVSIAFLLGPSRFSCSCVGPGWLWTIQFSTCKCMLNAEKWV